MEKNAFTKDGHYAVTLCNREGRMHPANMYVHRTEDDYLIARTPPVPMSAC